MHPAVLGGRFVHVGIEDHHFHFERRAQLHQAPSDGAEPDDTEGLAEQLAPPKRQPVTEWSSPQHAVGDRDLLGQVQHEAERMFGDRLRAGPGVVAHRDPGPRCRPRRR